MQLTYSIIQTGNFTLGNTMSQIASKVFQIIFQTLDATVSFSVDSTSSANSYDLMITRFLQRLQLFLYPGESLSTSFTGFDFTLLKLGTQSSSLPDLPTFSYDKQEVFKTLSSQAQNGGIMILARNETYAFAQVYDRNLNPLSITKLSTPVRMTFRLTEEYRLKYANGSAVIRCASRNMFADSWGGTRISITGVNNQTGEIQCSANHFTQYTLYVVDMTGVPKEVVNTTVIIVDPTTLNNKTINETVVIGKWNSTISNKTTGNNTSSNITEYNGFVFQDKPQVMYGVAIGTLVVFAGMHVFFKRVYKSEHKEQPQRVTKFLYVYDEQASKCRNLLTLYWLILQIFNPYLNLFLVYNKFLLRWIRNLLLQSGFLSISLAFGVNSAILSLDYSSDF